MSLSQKKKFFPADTKDYYGLQMEEKYFRLHSQKVLYGGSVLCFYYYEKKTLFYEWTEAKIFIKMSDYSQSTIKSHLFAMCFNPFHIMFLNRILKVLFCGIEERHKHLLCSLRSNIKKCLVGVEAWKGFSHKCSCYIS